jgi:hypothetical protein
MTMLERFVHFKDLMKEKEWLIDGFEFKLDGFTYWCIIRLYDDSFPKPTLYASFQATFFDQGNQQLEAPMNRNGFATRVDASKVREFFHIPYRGQGNNPFEPLYMALNYFAPSEISMKLPTPVQNHVLQVAANSDMDEAKKLYCCGIIRLGPNMNGDQTHRSAARDTKTRLLHPKLYTQFGADHKLTFRYSADPNDELPDDIIGKRYLSR